jgi:hypothetical protein
MGTQVSYAGRPYDKAIEAQRYHAVIAPPAAPVRLQRPRHHPRAPPDRPRHRGTGNGVPL